MMNISVDTKFLWAAWFILLILKTMDLISWSWWIVFLPMIVAIIVDIISIIIFFRTYHKY